MQTDFLNFKKSVVLQFLKSHFSLIEDMGEKEDIVQSIKNSSILKGSNLWILILAILICSIGLNVNSTAVIIGGMLISPLMGPINAIGFGVAIFDFPLIRSALKVLSFSVVTSIATSAFYFYLTPLGEAQSEILARTSPAFWDVLIAFGGGLAGMIGATRKLGNNVVPGVAIATALMPPLCTAGYGLATLQWNFLFGAFYLFLINSVFIILGALFITKLLHFPLKTYVDLKYAIRIRYAIFTVAILTITPSTYLAFHLVQQSILKSNIQKFISQEIQSDDSPVFSNRIIEEGKTKTLEIVVIGKEIDTSKIEAWNQKKSLYGLGKMKLRVSQPSVKAYGDQVLALRTNLLEEIYKKNEEKQNEKDKDILALNEELNQLKLTNINLQTQDKNSPLVASEVYDELRSLVPNISECALAITLQKDMSDSEKNKKILLGYLHLTNNNIVKLSEQNKIKNWLKTRTEVDAVQIIFDSVRSR